MTTLTELEPKLDAAPAAAPSPLLGRPGRRGATGTGAIRSPPSISKRSPRCMTATTDQPDWGEISRKARSQPRRCDALSPRSQTRHAGGRGLGVTPEAGDPTRRGGARRRRDRRAAWSPEGRGAASGSTSRRGCTRSARSRRRRCCRSIWRRRSRWPEAPRRWRSGLPDDQPGHARRHDRVSRRRTTTSAWPEDDLFLFCQGTMPAVDMATGKLLLADKGLACSSAPDGHGGTVAALDTFKSERVSRTARARSTTCARRGVEAPVLLAGRQPARADRRRGAARLPPAGAQSELTSDGGRQGDAARRSSATSRWSTASAERDRVQRLAGRRRRGQQRRR